MQPLTEDPVEEEKSQDLSTSGNSIRRRFLEFYAARGHKILPSSSLVPDDPTVLLTIAGMLQFKPIFLGKVLKFGQTISLSPTNIYGLIFIIIIFRFRDRSQVLQLLKGVYVPMILRMLEKHLDTIHSLKCSGILALVITSRKKQ